MPAEPADPFTPDQIGEIYRTLVKPTIFADSAGGEATPTLVLLSGQPGSGKSRASSRLVGEHLGMVALSGDDLRIFHPEYRQLISDAPEHAGPILAEATRPWVRSAIQDALEDRRSLLLEGTFGDSDTTLATADRFRQAGFHVRVVALAAPRVLSVITVASRYLRDLKVGNVARFTRLSAHDNGYEGTTRLVDTLEQTNAVNRVTIVSRKGTVLLDQSSGVANTDASFTGASRALHAGRHPGSWGARSTMELLGELKQVTRFAIESGHLTPGTADLLIEAHRRALDEVVPRLSVEPDSPQAQFIHQAVSEQLVRLRRAATFGQPPAPEPALSSLPDLAIEPDR